MEARLLGVQAGVAPGQRASKALRDLELRINDHKVLPSTFAHPFCTSFSHQ